MNAENIKHKKVASILLSTLFIIIPFLSRAADQNQLFYKKIDISNEFYLEIEELTNGCINFNLYKNNNLKKSITHEYSGIENDLIQKINLRKYEKEYFITTYYTFVTYNALSNIIVWKNRCNGEWDLFSCPFTTGYAEDRNNDGIYEIIEYYGQEQIYSFKNGYLVKMGDKEFFEENMIVKDLDLEKAKTYLDLKDTDKIYFTGYCKITPTKIDIPVIINTKDGYDQSVFISLVFENNRYEIEIKDVDIDKFNIDIVKIQNVTGYQYPQLLIELSDGKNNDFLYVVSWVKDHFDVIFKQILFNNSTKTAFYYKFYSQEYINKIKIWNGDFIKHYYFDNNTYIEVN